MLSGCLKDLDTKPLNDNDFTADKAYSTPESYLEGMAKIYGGFVMVGSEPGTADIAVSDAGRSELNRAFWTLQEWSTDAVKYSWSDNGAWVNEMNYNTWTATRNDNIYSLYARTMMLVSYVNEYLRQTASDRLDERKVSAELRADIHKYRSEARFIRAYAWWMGLDAFGNMPFVTENDPMAGYYPPQKPRAELFEYIESELIALTTDANLAEARQNEYPRVDKGCAWALLARLYLNAEVYSGTTRWADAKQAAANAIAGGYQLAGTYRHLFMGDNGTNTETLKEIIFAVVYDSEKTRSYGGSSFIIASCISGDDNEKDLVGSLDPWGGLHTSGEFPTTYFDISDINYTAGTYTCADERALFNIKNRQFDMENAGDQKHGWGVIKFSSLPSTGGATLASGAFSSTDMPMIRLAEMYLVYIEAAIRGGGTSTTDATALGYYKALGTRAGVDYSAVTSVSLDDLFEERTRELYWEGHRRTDLIRFGYYTSGDFLWPWKGGVKVGRAIDDKYKLCPLPSEDRLANPNLTNNNGY